MASTTLSRTISSVVDQRIVLANSNFARPHGVSTWTKLRVAVRLSITDSGANITSNPRLAIGLCSGSTNIFLDATTTHWVGCLMDGATWTRGAGPPIQYAMPSSGWVPAKRVGSTTSKGTTHHAGADFLHDATAAFRSLWCVDITKGSPNFTYNLYMRNSAGTSDVTLANFLANVELASPNVNAQHFQATQQTLAVDEADGTLDHVNIAWDRSDPKIEISDLAIVRLS